LKISKSREGKISPARGQQLYWVKFGMWAIGKSNIEGWEIFSATPCSMTECGYIFKFKYYVQHTHQLLQLCEIHRPYCHQKAKANLDILSVYLPRFLHNYQNDGQIIKIDTSYKPFDKEKVFTRDTTLAHHQ